MNTIKKQLQQNINNLDIPSLAREFHRQQFLVIDNFLSPAFVQQHFVPEVDQCLPLVHRVYVAGFKKSGSVSSQILERQGTKLFQLYHLEIMQKLIANIVGLHLFVCPKEDPHSVALYYYTEPGDHIGFHYDKSFYRGKRFTVLLGLIQDSVHSNLLCYPDGKRSTPVTVVTNPGTLVMFNGDVLWHKVTPLAQNERRVIVTLEYVTDPRMTFLNKFISNFKDRFLYFGKTDLENA